MDEKKFCMHKNQNPHRERTRHFRKTISTIFCFTVLIVIAGGFLCHFGVLDDYFTYQHAATQVNGVQGNSSIPASVDDNDDNSKTPWKYGFILRYPSDKTDITGCNYEPWYYRYVGKEAAKQIYRQSLCLEEYLALISIRGPCS